MTTATKWITTIVLASLWAGTGCGPDDPLPEFGMRVHFNTDQFGRCSVDACDAYPMGCGAILSLRIVSADTVRDADGNLEPVAVYVDRCIRVPVATNLCALGGIDLGDLPPVPADKKSQLQIALWSPADLELGPNDPVTDATCPKDIFNLRGVPLQSPEFPQPAFGGAVYFKAGETAIVDVPLACTNPSDLNAIACLENSIAVTARVDDLETGIFVPPVQAQAMTVSIAKPTEQFIDEVNTEWVILPENSHDLILDTGELIPMWSAAVQEDFGNTACILALDRAEPQPTTTAFCTAVDPTSDELPNMRGYLVSQDNREAFLTAMGEPELPSEGMVVGRVVDHEGVPLSGVSVTPVTPDPMISIEYLNELRDGTTGIVTSSNGYFFVRNAPFGTAWQAEHLGDNRRENGTYRAGNLVGKISVVEIEMEPPL